ncbi:unnamed protein product [Rhizoctonia solani]|uniref:F-box domain-containing protein n=1 Tax=Rhizoctonia solani TaxID=456999 RepID=A0A8H3HA10_9AGAM|nr:unnamed protein product [Rhizoctonia solani]
MPGVICYRTPSQDCILLGHLYRSSYSRNAQLAACEVWSHQEASSLISQPTGHYTKAKPNCRLCSPADSRLTLLSVSPEIVLLILARLPGWGILKCRYVCKVLKRLIDQSTKLQYIIQSNARGLEPLGDSSSASSDLSNLLFRERSWTMFGSMPGIYHSLQNPPDPANGSTSKRYSTYNLGKLVLCSGSHIVEHTLHSHLEDESQQHHIPNLGAEDLDPVGATHGILVYSNGSTIYIYSKVTNEVVSIVSVPYHGTLGVPSVRGSWIAALFRSEYRCNGVLIWNWKSGKLIDALHEAFSPALSIAFFDETTLAVVHTDRSACSARIDTYELSTIGAELKLSVSLPDAHPSKWYAKVDIYTGDESAPLESERMMCNAGIVAIDLEMRMRAPHYPETIAIDRVLNAILVMHKRIFSPVRNTNRETPIIRVPWTDWCADHFRMLIGVRLSPQRPVWGYRLVAVGPEPDKVSLFDFCPVGVRTVAQVWKGNGTWGASSAGRGGVSVRAAMAQRARTLVRVNTLGVAAGWFDNLKPSVDQIPYVVSVRRGVRDIVDTMLDGGNIIVTLRDRDPAEHTTSTRIILFNFIS